MRIKMLAFLLVAIFTQSLMAQQNEISPQVNKDDTDDTLIILWATGDPEVAETMLLMYANAAQQYGWFKQVKVIVWGPSARLLAAHKDLQAKVKEMIGAGVAFEACVACASHYGVVDLLKALGIDVKGMGGPLTEYIKSNKHIITI